MVLAVAGPWFAMVGIRTGGNFLREFFGVQNYGRFMGAMDNHSGGIWYYPLVILLGFFPWSIFGIPTMLDIFKRCSSADPWQRGSKFLACWIVVYVGFFSLAATKLPNYVLPAYPGLALATGCLIERWLKRPEGVRSLWPRLSLGSLVLVGCLAVGALLWVGKGSIHGRPVLAQLGVSETLASDIVLASSLGVILLVGGCISIFFAETRRATAAMVGVAVTALTFCLLLLAGIAVKVDRHQPSPVLAEAIREHAGDRAEIAQFGYFRPSLVYYTDSRVEACKTPQRLVEFLQQPNAVVVTNEDQYSRLAAELPADVIVVEKSPEFPRQGTVVVLGKKTTMAQRNEGRAE
jgi:4-amino-4-deoxy-L-arabinose transferase-like glycosyltransferase